MTWRALAMTWRRLAKTWRGDGTARHATLSVVIARQRVAMTVGWDF